MERLNIPVGISDFEKIRRNQYYYVDKSGLIEELLNHEATEATLITRPRRFGKTLAMSMLASFFDIRRDSRELFCGLEISRNAFLCEQWMNQYPTLFFSFKRVEGLDFAGAYEMLSVVIAEVYKEHLDLAEDGRINRFDREIFSRIAGRSASPGELKSSLLLLTRLMASYYQKPVILLIDEYDVPLAKASNGGYYREMLDVVKGLLQVLKDNPSLKFAVITGCLQIAKESIFTGTNNFVSDTISSTRLNEFFGFTQADVEQILADTDMACRADSIKAWYDGYRFGDFDVYCPWDIMNYMRDLEKNPDTLPASYWKNTSDNAIVRSFIDHAGFSITAKLETLMSGGYILQRLEENLTYDALHASEENLWSILYLTGYLTRLRKEELPQPLPDELSALKIPNAEIREIFQDTILQWFDDGVKSWNRKALFEALWKGDGRVLTEEIGKLLRRTISYHDYREDFYHAFLAGIFAGAGFGVESNREHGEGRSDLVVSDPAHGRTAVFEVKYSHTAAGLEGRCEEALRQIDSRGYGDALKDSFDSVFCYGIAFYKKKCLVLAK